MAKKKTKKTTRVASRYWNEPEPSIQLKGPGDFYTEFPLAILAKDGDLPDITPQYIDRIILNFESKLCCNVNSVAIIYKKVVCADCFGKLKAKYTGEHWDIQG